MFKSLALVSLLALSGLSQAATINLGPVGCGILKECNNIPNDTAQTISIVAIWSYPNVHLYIDGDRYDSPTGNGYTFDNLLLTDANGNTALLSGSFTTYQTCIRSGRGQHCSIHWQFVGGTVTL